MSDRRCTAVALGAFASLVDSLHTVGLYIELEAARPDAEG